MLQGQRQQEKNTPEKLGINTKQSWIELCKNVNKKLRETKYSKTRNKQGREVVEVFQK